MLKTKLLRLGSRFLWCFLSFIVGCTLTVSFTSISDCTNFKVVAFTSAGKSQEVDQRAPKTLVVLILSAPDNIQKRHALRQTWLTLIDHENIKYYFVIGKQNLESNVESKLLTEDEQYSDLLLISDLEEGYHFLTRKVIAAFLWVVKNEKFEFLLKVDDDSFVDIRQLHRELLRKSNLKKLYWGYFNGRAQVQRKGKWKELNWNLCDRYLPYARGGGYVLSHQLAQYIAQNAMLLSLYKNEDVSVGAWLAPLNVTRVHDIRLNTEWSSRGCSNQYIVSHPHNIPEMHALHDSLTNNGHLCKLEFHKRSPYIYDWAALPSLCCDNLVL